MPAALDVVGDVAVEGRVYFERVEGRKILRPKKRERGRGVYQTEQLTFGVGPEVLGGTRGVEHARGNQRHKVVLVDGHRRNVVRVLLEVGGKPVRKVKVYHRRRRFPVVAARKSLAHAAGVVRANIGKAEVVRARNQSGLAEARVPDDRKLRHVDFGQRFKQVGYAHVPPRPSDNRGARVEFFAENLVDAFVRRRRALAVGIDVHVAERCDCVAARNDVGNGNARRFFRAELGAFLF